MHVYIAIDDTDNLESRGTGFRARQLALGLREAGLATPLAVVRHQLLVHPDIPYTSHNSSASILVETEKDKKKIIAYGEEFLLRESADGADAGLCVADENQISPSIILWGELAKRMVLTEEEAYSLSSNCGIYLKGLTGRKTGVIGSLAAVGLAVVGNDGRVLWLKNLRETSGILSISELKSRVGIDEIISVSGLIVNENDLINTGEWCRPIMLNKKITIFVEEDKQHETYQWRVASKELIKAVSE